MTAGNLAAVGAQTTVAAVQGDEEAKAKFNFDNITENFQGGFQEIQQSVRKSGGSRGGSASDGVGGFGGVGINNQGQPGEGARLSDDMVLNTDFIPSAGAGAPGSLPSNMTFTNVDDSFGSNQGLGNNPLAPPSSSTYDRKPIGQANPLAPTPGSGKKADDDLDLEALLK